MAIINFENMKATEPDRNFDNVNVDENYNIGLQNGQGFYGAGKFFGLVQKAVNWISTITGNKNFTGILSVNSKEVATTESVNNALANYQNKNYITNLADANSATSNGIVNSYRVSGSCLNIPVERIGILTVYGYVSGQYHRTTQEFITNDDDKNVKKYIRSGMSNNNGTSWTWGNWEKLTTESELKPTITPITTTNSNVNIVNGGFSKIGNLVVINLRFSVTQANSLITFDTNAPSPILSPKQYIPLNIINIQQDTEELTYGYKQHSNGGFVVKIPRANIEYALSCTYICS